MFLRQIEYFQAVVEKGNFYLAAEKCNVSQSAISQQIKKLEEETGVQLLDRHNRTFTLTKAGAHFYRKSVVIMDDIKQLIAETKRISNHTNAVIRLGYYKGYSGDELTKAIADFSQKYPTVDIEIISGSHEQLYHALEDNTVDLVLNDQRRAFSSAYHNIVLSESRTYIEISSRNSLSKLKEIEIDDLKNMQCILVKNVNSRDEERQYYEKIVGLRCNYIFSETQQDARLKISTGQGFMPVDVIGEQKWFDTAVSRIPLLRNGEQVTKIYCAFWKKDNSGYYIEEFADMLQNQF